MLVSYFCLRCKLKGKDEVIANLERELQKCKNESKETLIEFGRVSVENDRKVREERKERIFEKIFKSGVANVSSTPSEAAQLSQTAQLPQAGQLPQAAQLPQPDQLPQAAQLPQADEASTSAAAMQTVEVNPPSNIEIQPAVSVDQELLQNDEVPVPESSRMRVRLAYVPSTAVERHIYNNYKLLVLMISAMLLCSEVEKFKEWARNMYRVDISSHLFEGLLELDQKGIISASDLTNLKEFFEKLLRFDLVHLIDYFIEDDYTSLKGCARSIKNNNPSRNTRTAGLGATSSIANPKRSLTLGRRGAARNFGTSQGVDVEESFPAKPAEVQNSQLTQNNEGAFGQNTDRAGLVATTIGVAHNKHGKIK